MSSIELHTLTLPNITTGPFVPPEIDISNSLRTASQVSVRSDTERLQTLDPIISGNGLSRLRASFIVASVAGITLLNCLGQSLLIVAIPQVAEDLQIPPGLIQWPTAAATLTLGCLLLVVGAIADVVGNRPMFLAGCALHLFFGIGCALAQTGSQLIASRALQGLALSLCMPTSVGIITTNFPEGKRRNIAFASFGGGNPVGYALGLLLGGIFVKTVGWRYAYYFSLALNAAVFVSAFFSLPTDTADRGSLNRLKSAVDWIGLALISASLAILSYVLASITSESSLSPKHPRDIALLILAILLIPCFVAWVGRQESRGKPAIIPNSLWRQSGFTSVCVATFLTWAMFNALAFFATLLMQKIQHISPLQTSLQFLPLVILSVLANFVAGFLVDKVAAGSLSFGATLLSAGAPLIFAVLSPDWSFWAAIFPAMCLIPLSSDFLFNIANLVITSTFSTKDQALAGGVFNTVSQLGSSMGLAITAAIAASLESAENHGEVGSTEVALKGYRTVFWTCLGAALASCAISTVGLRKSGKVGLKKE